MEPGAKTGSDEFQAGRPPKPPGRSGLHWGKLRQLSARTPLRIKLITAVLTLVIMAIAAISIASTYMLHSYLIQQHDGDVRAAMNSAIAQIETTHQLPRHVDPGLASPTFSSVVYGIQLPGSQLDWESTPNLPPISQDPLPLLPTAADWAGKNLRNPPILTTPAQTGPNTWRVMGLTVDVTQDGQTSSGTLIAAVDLGNIDAVTRQLILFDLGVGAAIVLILALVAIAVVRANLRPLDDIELTAGQIAAGHLDHRIPERDPRTEVGSLGRSLNTMLSQIEAAFHAREESEQAAHRSEERMRRFIADASHELRTPLTTIRGFAEYYRQRGGVKKIKSMFGATDSGASGMATGTAQSPPGMTPEELDRIMKRLESEAARMGLLVEDLLQLARLDQQRPLEAHPVDLLTLAADAVQDARLVAPERNIDLSVAPGAAFLVNGDEQRLRQVIGNLVSNALTHTPAGASVRVTIASGTLKSGDPAVVLDVIDDGPGMSTEQAQRVFERFYRADAARNRASGGTGLGLAIVAGLVGAHGGQVSVKTAPGEGADFRVKLPLSPDALPSDDLSADDLAADDLPSDNQPVDDGPAGTGQAGPRR
jgi:two-component system, OmpR family, sensor kinase